MKWTTENICLIGLFSLGLASLIALVWAPTEIRTPLISISTSVVVGVLGYMKGKSE